MKKLILLIIIFLSQGIMSWGQSDTLSYESIMGYYKSKTHMIEFYQMAGNDNKVSELKKERDAFVDSLDDNYSKGKFFLLLSREYYYYKDYKNAIKECDKAVIILKKVLGEYHIDYIASLNLLTVCNFNFGNYSEAVRLGGEVVELSKKVWGNDTPEYAQSLNNLANYISRLGNYKEAIRLSTEAAEIVERFGGIEYPDYALYLNNLSSHYSFLGNYSEAIRLCSEAKKIWKKVLGTDHQDYAKSLVNLAAYYYQLGNYTEAVRLSTDALEIYKKVLGLNHPDYAQSLNNLAIYISALGNYTEAVRLSTDALEIFKRVVGIDHPDYAQSLNILSNFYYHLGNYKEAIRIGTQAIETIKNKIGKENLTYALYVSALSTYFSCVGNNTEAIRLSTDALGIIKNTYGIESPYYRVLLSNLASLNRREGNYTEALRLGMMSMELWKKLSPNHPNYAKILSILANIHFSLGNNSEAIRFEKEAIQICSSVLGEKHHDYISYLTSLANYNYSNEDYSHCLYLLMKAVDNSQLYILNNFSELSSGLQESLWINRYAPRFLEYLPSTVYRYPTRESVAELYDKTVLFAKGILLNSSVGMRKLILESGDSVLVAKYDALAANKSIYDKQLEKPIKERIIDIDSLQSVIQRQEMELARDSKAYGDFARNLRIKWQDVHQRLGNNDLAIEFLDFPLYGTDSTMYVALTLKKGYDNPHMTILFEKRQLKSITEDHYYTNTDLYNLIWKPLEKELSGVENVYFSPSGDLHRIGIEYIPVTMTENICDKYNLHRLSSTRQLAYIQDETKGDKCVLYGGLKYDAVSDTIPASPSTRENRGYTFVSRAIVDSLDIRGSYKYLPGTKEEADHIASYLGNHSIPYKYYYGAAGTEESFKGLDGSKPKTLHIATHGFYMTEQDAERKNFARPLLQEENRVYHEDKQMTRSGLLLSGCNRALNHENIPDGIEDGILTADEISKLDLRGLDLVVLSACQTGLGDITSGEGVFGLQRGFKNAGAKTIIMSLWKVSDIATQHLMTSFYNHYLSGMPKEQSFRMAQKELREMIGSGQNKPDWAAFVMLDGI